MAVFRYMAVMPNREENVDAGTVVATTEEDALEKLQQLGLGNVRLKKIGGIVGFFKGLTADVK